MVDIFGYPGHFFSNFAEYPGCWLDSLNLTLAGTGIEIH